jgi:hypothetical protein
MAFALSTEQLDVVVTQSRRIDIDRRAEFLQALAALLQDTCFNDREFSQAVTTALRQINPELLT